MGQDPPAASRPAAPRRLPRPLGGPYTFLWESSWNALILQVALVTLLLFTALPPPRDLSPQGLRALGVFVTCFLLWMTGALPLAVTGLLAISLISLLRILPAAEAFALFGNTAVFFILGSFMLAAALMKSGLSKRIAILILIRFGRSRGWLLTGVYAIAWALSLVMSEHAVVAALFPVVLEIVRAVEEEPERSPYARGLMWALGWGAIIGGTGTLLGGARAPLALGILKRLTGIELGFLDYTRVVFPVTLAMGILGLALLFLFARGGHPDVPRARERLSQDVASLGPLSREEKGVAVVFVLTVLVWVFMGRYVDLATTAILASVTLFVFRLLSWSDTEEYVNWGIILMYGGAVALGTALSETGAAEWVAHLVLPWGAPRLLLLGSMVLLAAMLTEGMSSAAVVAFLLPLAIGVGKSLGMDPRPFAYLLAVAAGLVYIFPTGAPPIAIVYSSKILRIRDSLLPGVVLHLLSWTVILLWVRFFWPRAGLP
jgi:sodium-dependent dicarboxylate transporter 2/3/5